ncbi:MAG: hypothetical protein ABI726_02485 [bacterium]
MDFSRLDRNRLLLGGISGALLVVALFLPWYSLSHSDARVESGAWLCGEGNYSCSGFDTFPILRWLLLLFALSPLILAWILVRGHKLSWAPGEMTMVAGFSAMLLMGYNGLLDIPAPDEGLEFGTSLSFGYFIALACTIGITVTGFLRSQAGQKRERKAPGTV